MNNSPKFKKLHLDAVIPTRGTLYSAGLDLYSIEDLSIPHSSWLTVMTGLSVAIPRGCVGMVCPRSGLALKGVTVLNAPGIIDADFRGELKVVLVNHSANAISIHKKDRIAQIVIVPVNTESPVEVDELDETERGEGGFGSTGV